MAVSPDDCSLALRGLQTLAIRLSAVETSALIKTVFTGDPSEQTGLIRTPQMVLVQTLA
jgi:cystathionine beta-lyase/cystathionine gamma-synthase